MNVKQLMAKALINSGEDYCAKYCVDRQKCNERLREQELNNKPCTLPPENVCIKNIIQFFENEANKEQSKS